MNGVNTSADSNVDNSKDAAVVKSTKTFDWVKDLFPPTFTLDVNSQLISKTSDSSEVPLSNKTDEEDDDLFKRLTAKKVSPMDISAIRNVYHRVWLMTKAYSIVEDNDASDDYLSNAAALSSTSKRDSSTQTGQLNEHITTNAVATTDSDSCIWDQAELGILRQEFRSVKAENVGLKGRLAVLEKELSKYTHGNRQQQKTINLLKAQLNEAHTANRRLHMLSQHLKQELDRTTANVEQLRSTENDRNRLAITVQQLEAKLLNEEQTSKQKQAALEMKWTALLEQQRLGDVVKISDLTTELNRLVSSIHDLETQLTTEKTEHSRTRKGLEHLQKHFSSLPQSGEKLNTSGRGQRDQLMKLMY